MSVLIFAHQTVSTIAGNLLSPARCSLARCTGVFRSRWAGDIVERGAEVGPLPCGCRRTDRPDCRHAFYFRRIDAMKKKPKRKRAPGGGRKPLHSPDAKLVQIRLPPDIVAMIADSGMTQQDFVITAIRAAQ